MYSRGTWGTRTTRRRRAKGPRRDPGGPSYLWTSPCTNTPIQGPRGHGSVAIAKSRGPNRRSSTPHRISLFRRSLGRRIRPKYSIRKTYEYVATTYDKVGVTRNRPLLHKHRSSSTTSSKASTTEHLPQF